MNCTYKDLHAFNDSQLACDYLKNCNYEYDYFTLLTFNYCIVDNRQYITWPLIAIVFLLCFYFLSTSVDEYVSRIVGRMSVKLNMSQNLAGLTLLAFGNQVADITVAMVSGGEAEEGIEASLSTILGADSFVIGLVMPTVIFLGNGVIVKGQNFTRDLLTYLIALILIFSLGIFARKLNLIYGIIIFCLYIVYVVLCIIMEKMENNKKFKNLPKKKERNENESIGQSEKPEFRVKLFQDDEEKANEKDDNKNENDEEEKEEEENENKNKKEDKEKMENDKKEEDNDKKEEDNKEENIKNKDNKNNEEDENNITMKIENEGKKKNDKKETKKKDNNKKKEKEKDNKSDDRSKDDSDEMDILSDKKSLFEDIASLGGPVIFNINDFKNDEYYKNRKTEVSERQNSKILGQRKLVYNRLHYTLAKYYLNSKEEKWSEISFFKKLLKIFIEFPLTIIRDLTTPPFEKEKWRKGFFALMPLSISLCISLLFNLFPYYLKFPHFIIIAAYYLLILFLCYRLYKRSYRGSLPNCEWVLLISALIMSMIWIFTVTKILVQMINDSQFLLPFEVSRSFLIMTVLAVGNALPDFLIDITLSKSGYAEMALSGTIGSPVFSLLFGFGLSLIKTFLFSEEKEQVFDLMNFTPSIKVILCAIGCLFINLVHYMLVFSLVNYKVKRYVSYTGFFLFISYLVCIFLVSFIFK